MTSMLVATFALVFVTVNEYVRLLSLATVLGADLSSARSAGLAAHAGGLTARKLASAAVTVASATKERNPGLVRIAASLLDEAANGSRLRGRGDAPDATCRPRRELSFTRHDGGARAPSLGGRTNVKRQTERRCLRSACDTCSARPCSARVRGEHAHSSQCRPVHHHGHPACDGGRAGHVCVRFH